MSDLETLKSKALHNSYKFNKHHELINKIKYNNADDICSKLIRELSQTSHLFKIWIKYAKLSDTCSIVIKFYNPQKHADYIQTIFNKMENKRTEKDSLKFIVKDAILQKHIADSLINNYTKILEKEFICEQYEFTAMEGEKIELFRIFTY